MQGSMRERKGTPAVRRPGEAEGARRTGRPFFFSFFFSFLVSFFFFFFLEKLSRPMSGTE